MKILIKFLHCFRNTVEKDRKRSYDEIVTESTKPKPKPKKKEKSKFKRSLQLLL